MIRIKKLMLSHIVHFKEAELDIKKGLHIIRGLNKSSHNRNQNNAAGKSLLFSPIANILVSAPPILSKKKGKADLLSKKSCGYIHVLTHDKKHAEIYQYLNKYEIWENDVDLNISTPSKAEKQIREYFPLNELEFYSTVYLTTQQHSFQIASPSDRLKFISDLFRLHEYDVLKKHFTSQLRLIKDSETEHRALLTELIKCEQQLAKIEWGDSTEDDLARFNLELKDLQQQLTMLQDKSMEFSKMSVVKKQLDTLNSKLNKLGKIKNPKERRKKLLAAKEQCESWNNYERQLANYSKTVSGIKDQLKSIKSRFTVDEVTSLLKKAKSDYETIRTQLESIIEVAEEWGVITKKKESLEKRLADFDFDIDVSQKENCQKKIYAAEAILELRTLLKNADCDTVECPTCKSDFDTNELKKSIKRAKDDIEKYSELLEAIKVKQDLDSIVIPKYDADEHYRLSDEHKEYRQYIKSLEDQLETARTKETLEKTLSDIKKPVAEVDEPEYALDDIVDKLNACEEYIRISKEIESLLDDHDYKGSFNEDKYDSIKKKLADVGKRVNTLHNQIKSLENNKTSYELLKKNQADIQEKLEALKDSIDNKRVIESLVAAYGPKGIKVNIINNLCRNLENNFNSLATFIFNENFEFEFNVSSTGIDVIVHRPGGFSSDVKMLSGSESDAFKLLFLTSLLPMLPEDRRVNMVVLDEPDSHMDPVYREKFIHDFVPYLRSIIPSVYILTPNNDVYPDATTNYLVVKNKGISTLHQE